MDGMHLLSSHLDCNVLAINGKFSPKNKAFVTRNCCVPIDELKYEANNYTSMMDSSYAVFHNE